MYSLSMVTDSHNKGTSLALPPGLSPIRQKHWMNSRLALLKSVELSLLPSEEMNPESSILIEDHHSLKHNPKILASLAHTRGAACAVTTRLSEKMLAIGVDIEASNRIVNPDTLDKFLNKSDRTQGNSLEAWCVKEAAFKAASYFWKRQKVFILKDIEIDLEKSMFKIPNLVEGFFESSIEDGFLRTVAIVNKLL